MTYMPDRSLASEELSVGEYGTILLFEVYELDHCEESDPYREILANLDKDGLHRNLFLVDQEDHLVWRVSDYTQNLPDCFLAVRSFDEETGEIVGVTFHGTVFSISLKDGSLKKIGWEKT